MLKRTAGVSRLAPLSVAVLVAALVLAACGGGSNTPAPATPTTQSATAIATPTTQRATATAVPSPTVAPTPTVPQPIRGGIINLGHVSDPSTLDPRKGGSPQSLNMISPMYSKLVTADPKNNERIVGDLAKSWQANADGTAYTFSLQPNAKWHDGRPITADDAKAGLEAMIDQKTGYSLARSLMHDVVSMEAVDAGTLRLNLKQPGPGLLARLYGFNVYVLPQHYIAAGGDLAAKAFGSGAYKFVEYRRGSTLRMERNQDYFVPGLPHLDGISVFPIPDSGARVAALRVGQVDQLTRWSALEGGDAEELKKNTPDLILDRVPVPNAVNVVLKTTKQPWDNVKVRRAIFLGLDRQKAITVIGQGNGNLVAMPLLGKYAIPQEELLKMPGFRPSKTQDIADAKQALKEAGVEKFEARILYNSSNATATKGAILLEDMLKGLGINAVLNGVSDFVAYSKSQNDGDYDILVATTVNVGQTDPDGLAVHLESATGTALRYKNPDKVTELFRKQSVTFDETTRIQLVKEMQQVWIDEVPAISLFQQITFQPRWPRVKNFYPGIGSYLNDRYEDVWIEKK